MPQNQKDLIIFHYHLLPGGVTDVVSHALGAFCRSGQFKSIKVVCGRQENTERISSLMEKLAEEEAVPSMSLEVLPQLDYRSNQSSPWDSNSIKTLLMNNFASDQSIWLVHNFHLGKNWAFTEALNIIAREGHQKMIYQIHDFPECARFENLKELRTHIDASLYPQSPSLRYCVINVRDFEILKKAGIQKDYLFLLENPVPAADNPAKEQVDQSQLKKKLISCLAPKGRFHEKGDLWLYPVRSIRRKNVLEGGFLSLLQEDPVNMILTLPGISPQEKAYSDLCQKAFEEGLIYGFWGTGTLPDEAGISYREMISGSDMIFSPSVQEGFGYMYLNALLWQKPLLARHLDIMGGFEGLMNNYPAHLYNRVLFPADKTIKTSLEREYSQRFSQLSEHLSLKLQDQLKSELSELLKGDAIDISYLSPAQQYKVLEQCRDESYLKDCRNLNKELLDKISRLRKTSVMNKEDELYSSYGIEAYNRAFLSITESFTKKGDAKFLTPEEEKSVDLSLQKGFTKMEFLRMLYS